MTTRARWLWVLTGVLTVVAVIVLVVATRSPKARPGCVDTTLPGVIGAQTFDECGQDARQTCATVKESQRQFGATGVLIVENACRKGGLSVG